MGDDIAIELNADEVRLAVVSYALPLAIRAGGMGVVRLRGVVLDVGAEGVLDGAIVEFEQVPDGPPEVCGGVEGPEGDG